MVIRPGGPARRPAPDLDEVLGAVVALIEAATYADAIRREDEVAMTSAHRGRPAGAGEIRDAAYRAESKAQTALFDLLDHERAMRLIPGIAGRDKVVRRAEAAYRALTDDADGVS